jgi:hypothetical protein
MGQFAEFLAMGMGVTKDAQGNFNFPGNQGAPPDVPAPAPAPDAPAAAAAPQAAAAPAQAVAPVKATTPQASVPEPPVVGQSADDADAAAKKKTLLGN